MVNGFRPLAVVLLLLFLTLLVDSNDAFKIPTGQNKIKPQLGKFKPHFLRSKDLVKKTKSNQDVASGPNPKSSDPKSDRKQHEEAFREAFSENLIEEPEESRSFESSGNDKDRDKNFFATLADTMSNPTKEEKKIKLKRKKIHNGPMETLFHLIDNIFMYEGDEFLNRTIELLYDDNIMSDGTEFVLDHVEWFVNMLVENVPLPGFTMYFIEGINFGSWISTGIYPIVKFFNTGIFWLTRVVAEMIIRFFFKWMNVILIASLAYLIGNVVPFLGWIMVPINGLVITLIFAVKLLDFFYRIMFT